MKFADSYPKVAIIGLGNVLLADDGVGVHAVRQLLKDPPENVVVAEVGTAVFRAQQLLEEADVVIAIDAVRNDGPAGSVYRFDAVGIEDPSPVSLHELGIVGLLRLMPEQSRPEVIIVGVQPKVIDYGTELSPRVQAAVGTAVEAARKIAREIMERAPRSSVN
jgi:hydrogenase maturation protease